MKSNISRTIGFGCFMAGLMYLSTIHNDTNAASPYSNIQTSHISTGFLLRTNDYGTNESFVSMTAFLDANSNIVAFFNGTNFIFTSVGLITNKWNGPTNLVDVRTNHYTYHTVTPILFQGIAGSFGIYALNPTVKIINDSSSNITINLIAGIKVPIGDVLPYTLTNGDTWIGSFDISDGQTNIMAKEWH